MQLSPEQQNLLIQTTKEATRAVKTAENAYALAESTQTEIKSIKEMLGHMNVPQQKQLTVVFSKPIETFEHQIVHNVFREAIEKYGITSIDYRK